MSNTTVNNTADRVGLPPPPLEQLNTSTQQYPVPTAQPPGSLSGTGVSSVNDSGFESSGDSGHTAAQASGKTAWAVLPLSFAMLMYMIVGLSSFDGDTTLIQWGAAIGGIAVCLLMIFQSVKGLMQEDNAKSAEQTNHK